MYRLISFKLYSVTIVTIILLFGNINIISSESISIQAWSNLIQDLSLKIHDYKSDDKMIESHPLNEGFILLAHNRKEPSTTTTKPTHLSTKTRISRSHNISSTTCTTIIMVKTKNRTSPPVGHLGRRLLNEPNYNTDTDTTSMQTPIENDAELDNFLKVNDEELSKQLFNLGVTVEASGETIEETTKQTTGSTSEQSTGSTPEQPTGSTTEQKTDSTPSQTTSSTPSQTTGSTLEQTTGSTSEQTIGSTIEQTSGTTMTSNLPTTGSTTPLVTATTITSGTEEPVLSNKTKVILTLNCTDANATLNQILKEFNDSYPYHYNVTDNMNEHHCNNSDKINITLEFTTDNNITIVNEIFETLKNTSFKGVEIFSDNVCGNNEIVRVPDVVTSCFVIETCHWCGTNPIRGKCLPQLNVSKCECFVNHIDPSRPYVGEYCLSKPEPIKSPSFPSYWTPVIVGILAGLTGLFLAITFCLWTVAAWRGPSLPPEKPDFRVPRLWNIPRAQAPTLVTNENVQNSLNNTISTSSSNQTDSDYDRSDISDTTFFKELDQKMGENLRATITRPNTQAMLASLPSDKISTLSYDPIDELDSIIDNEDVTFHDPLNELYEDNDLLEVTNPNIKLPRPNVDSKPTGLFSV